MIRSIDVLALDSEFEISADLIEFERLYQEAISRAIAAMHAGFMARVEEELGDKSLLTVPSNVDAIIHAQRKPE